MSAFILDSSVSMAWCFEDETNPYSETLLARLEADEEALVPSLWPLEVANALVTAKLRGRVTETQVAGFLEPLKDHSWKDTRQKTYPLLEECYKATNRLLELANLRKKIAQETESEAT